MTTRSKRYSSLKLPRWAYQLLHIVLDSLTHIGTCPYGSTFNVILYTFCVNSNRKTLSSTFYGTWEISSYRPCPGSENYCCRKCATTRHGIGRIACSKVRSCCRIRYCCRAIVDKSLTLRQIKGLHGFFGDCTGISRGSLRSVATATVTCISTTATIATIDRK